MGRSVHVGDVLLTCVKADGTDIDQHELRQLLAHTNVAEIPNAARYHRVVAPVYSALGPLDDVDSKMVTLLRALHREGALAQFRVHKALHQVREVLDPLDLPWLVVKGPVLSEVIYRRRGLRLYQDLDLLVPPTEFKRALQALEDARFEMLDPNWKFHCRWVAAELRLSLSGGADVDLHWHILFSREIRRFFRIPIVDVINRARQVVVHDLPVMTLDKADTLIHLTMHACREGGDRLGWLKDIEQSITNETPEWDDVVDRACDWRVNMLVGTMLARVRTTLAAPVPEGVVRALLPRRAWRVAITGADRLFPPHRSTARGTVATLLAHGARDNLRSTVSATSSDVIRMLRQIVGGEPWRREEWDRDRVGRESPQDPQSKLYPAGDERDRAWYLNELMRES